MGAEGEMGRSRSDDILCDEEDEALEAIVRWADEASRRVAATVDGQSSAAFLCSKVGSDGDKRWGREHRHPRLPRSRRPDRSVKLHGLVPELEQLPSRLL